MVFTPYESGMYSICVSLTRPLPDEFWEYGNPLVCASSSTKIEDMTEIDTTVNSLVKVLKEMTQEMEYQNVINGSL